MTKRRFITGTVFGRFDKEVSKFRFLCIDNEFRNVIIVLKITNNHEIYTKPIYLLLYGLFLKIGWFYPVQAYENRPVYGRFFIDL
jgi:hypothetical protein